MIRRQAFHLIFCAAKIVSCQGAIRCFLPTKLMAKLSHPWREKPLCPAEVQTSEAIGYEAGFQTRSLQRSHMMSEKMITFCLDASLGKKGNTHLMNSSSFLVHDIA